MKFKWLCKIAHKWRQIEVDGFILHYRCLRCGKTEILDNYFIERAFGGGYRSNNGVNTNKPPKGQCSVVKNSSNPYADL